MFEGNLLSIYNQYSPPPKLLHLCAIQPVNERFIIMGHFNSYSADRDLEPKCEEVKDWISWYSSTVQTSHMPTALEPGERQAAQTSPLKQMMWPNNPTSRGTTAVKKRPQTSTSPHEAGPVSGRLKKKQKNYAQAGTTKEQTVQNFVRKQTETAET